MLIQGDCLLKLKELPSDSVDSVITDPPAGISFMNKSWDDDKGGRDQWVAWMESVMRECLRVLKPGGHALVWAIPRTSHWTATAIEDAGFEVRDVVTHLFGSGFPKSLDISKAIDKEAGAKREVVGSKMGRPGVSKGQKPSCGAHGWHGFTTDELISAYKNGVEKTPDGCSVKHNYERYLKYLDRSDLNITAPATPEAIKWQGYGTALKPAAEFWILARKPISEKTVAKNVLKHGAGGLNIDASRIGENATQGRFPANLVLSGDAPALLDEQSLAGGMHSAGGKRKAGTSKQDEASSLFLGDKGSPNNGVRFGDSGGASRFFYCAKVSPSERGEDNNHPTVKPQKLMQYLIKLITPEGGIVLDPFMGSGSTGLAAKNAGFGFIGIEQDESYFVIATKRIEGAV